MVGCHDGKLNVAAEHIQKLLIVGNDQLARLIKPHAVRQFAIRKQRPFPVMLLHPDLQLVCELKALVSLKVAKQRPEAHGLCRPIVMW